MAHLSLAINRAGAWQQMQCDKCNGINTRHLKKTLKCLLSLELMNRFDFLTVFFFWKLRSIWKFWMQNQFCAMLRGWDIWKTKWDSGSDKYIFILNFLSNLELLLIMRVYWVGVIWTIEWKQAVAEIVPSSLWIPVFRRKNNFRNLFISSGDIK